MNVDDKGEVQKYSQVSDLSDEEESCIILQEKWQFKQRCRPELPVVGGGKRKDWLFDPHSYFMTFGSYLQNHTLQLLGSSMNPSSKLISHVLLTAKANNLQTLIA